MNVNIATKTTHHAEHNGKLRCPTGIIRCNSTCDKEETLRPKRHQKTEMASRKALPLSSKCSEGTGTSISHQLQLARAGFYYNPTSSCPDNVVCFLCNSNLDGWEDTDDPVNEHISHCHHCGWAITVAVENCIDKGMDELEDPMSERMVEARRMTFATGWPHENKRGWTCKVQKVAALSTTTRPY